MGWLQQASRPCSRFLELYIWVIATVNILEEEWMDSVPGFYLEPGFNQGWLKLTGG